MTGRDLFLSSPDATCVVANRVDHVAVATRDATAAAAWYVDNLGMMIVGDELVESAGVRLVYLAPGGESADSATMIQLAEPIGAGAIYDFIEERGDGLHHVCMTVDDIEAVVRDQGQSPDAIFMGGRGRRACFLREKPNGVLVELTETHPFVARS